MSLCLCRTPCQRIAAIGRDLWDMINTDYLPDFLVTCMIGLKGKIIHPILSLV